MKVQLIASEDRVVPLLGITVEAGSVIDVSDEIGGSAPRWRPPVDGELDDVTHLTYLRQTESLRYDDDGSIRSVYDLGSGLLAQVDVWARPQTAKPTTPKGD